MDKSLPLAAFSSWLNVKLRELQTDESVYGSYITSILENPDETEEEKSEAIEGILSEIISQDIELLIATIIAKWQESQPKETEQPRKDLTIDVDAQLTKLLEAQKLQSTVKEHKQTAEERRLKQQILAQYAQTAASDDDDDDVAVDCNAEEPTKSSGGGLVRNNNAHDVMQAQKERREQSRIESAAKKQKDKEDRERQKQQREEKKEKRKTVKGERRR